MAKTVQIPDFMVPSYKLTVNNTEYSYKAGSQVDVPDNVADIIKNNNDMLPREDPQKPSMSGLDHTVTFRDEDGNPVSICSVKDGVGNICAHSGVTAKRCVDADGNIVTFPVNPSANMVIAADNTMKNSDIIYEICGLTEDECKSIAVCHYGNSATLVYIGNVAGTGADQVNLRNFREFAISSQPTDKTDINNIVNFLVGNISSANKTGGPNASGYFLKSYTPIYVYGIPNDGWAHPLNG